MLHATFARPDLTMFVRLDGLDLEVFSNLIYYITRSLLETGGFRPQPYPRLG